MENLLNGIRKNQEAARLPDSPGKCVPGELAAVAEPKWARALRDPFATFASCRGLVTDDPFWRSVPQRGSNFTRLKFRGALALEAFALLFSHSQFARAQP